MTAAGLWPLPALLAWAGCWIVFQSARALAVPAAFAFAAAVLLGALLATRASTPWRRVFVGAGFPLSFAASGFAGALPPWAWLAPLATLLLLYPVSAWRDAPVFPTRRHSLAGLAGTLPMADGATILDAGCGLGDALAELRRVYPRARFTGVERSWPLLLVSRLRCRFATVLGADLWAHGWQPFDLVYVFQRPESMARAAAKAIAEQRPGAWLASLEFAVPGWPPTRVFQAACGRPLWLYRVGDQPATFLSSVTLKAGVAAPWFGETTTTR